MGRGAASEAALRRRISREVWRALADPIVARALLNDPAGVIDTAGCTLRQHRGLASIHATTVAEFAHQAELLFWHVADGSTTNSQSHDAA